MKLEAIRLKGPVKAGSTEETYMDAQRFILDLQGEFVRIECKRTGIVIFTIKENISYIVSKELETFLSEVKPMKADGRKKPII